jgi:hypothetical protein
MEATGRGVKRVGNWISDLLSLDYLHAAMPTDFTIVTGDGAQFDAAGFAPGFPLTW